MLVNADAQARAAAGTVRPIAGGAAAGVAERGFYSGAGSARALDGALIVAGLAAGLALGTKLNLLAPFAFLTLGVIAVSAGYRWRATWIWVVSSLVTGGFWFARNLVNAGNPLPWIKAGRCRAPTSSTSTSASRPTSPTTCCRPTAA